MDTVNNNLTTINSSITGTNLRLDTANNNLTLINASITGTNDKLDIITTILNSIEASITSTSSSGSASITGPLSITGSVVSHIYGAENGGSTFLPVVVDSSGYIIVQSLVKDASGNNITSTVNGGARGLDVNMITPISLSLTGLSVAVDLTGLATETTATNSYNTLLLINSSITGTNLLLDTSNNNLTTINASITGTNLLLDTVNTNLTTINSSITGTNQKIDTVNTNLTTINASITGTNNTLTNIQTSLTTTTFTSSITGSVKSNIYGSVNGGSTFLPVIVDTSGYVVTQSLTKDASGNNITSTVNGASRGLDVNISNGSTTNNLSNIGLNTYQIYPKVKTYMLSGINSTAAAYTLLSNSGTNVSYSAVSWGKQALKTFYASLTAGGSTKYIYFEYVDSNGDLQTTPVRTVSTTSGSTAITPACIGINRYYFANSAQGGANNQSFASTDNMYVSTTSGSTTPSYYGGFYTGNWNCTYTCPNNKVAILNTFSFYASSGCDLYGFICDVDGGRRLVLQVLNGSNFIYQVVNLQLTAGETLFFGTNNATPTSKQVVCQIFQYDV